MKTLSKIKVGDKIRVLKDYAYGTRELAGTILTVIKIQKDCVQTNNTLGGSWNWVFDLNSFKNGSVELVKQTSSKHPKLKSAQIIDSRFNNFLISENYNHKPTNTYLSILYTPNMIDTGNHYHIDLDLKQVKKLHKFLGEFVRLKKKC